MHLDCCQTVCASILETLCGCTMDVLPVIPADAVANMLENYVPPVMRATGSEKLSWLDENRNTVQAMEDIDIPNSAGLTVSKVCHGEQPNIAYCTLHVSKRSIA